MSNERFREAPIELNEVLRNIPQVDELLKYGDIPKFREFLTSAKIKEIVRDAADKVRRKAAAGEITASDRSALTEKIARYAVKAMSTAVAERGTRLINGTGIIIHTNLGRAPLSEKAAKKVYELSRGYSNLEYGCYEGKRRSRLTHIERQITDITGAEAAIVVNNNAAAVFLALNTLCKNRGVFVSRGEIVEIGDSFRISEIIKESGSIVCEVGTTNKTYAADYEAAVKECENPGALLKVHTSNFKIVGFTNSVRASELAALSEKYQIPLVEDMGSGVLFDLREIGLKYERTVQAAVKDNVDIITFSGDKMLGGPQAGIIAGKRRYIELMRKNQLMRCLRADKMTLAALEATITHYFNKDHILEIPIYKMAAIKPEKVRDSAIKLKALLAHPKLTIEVKPHYAEFGGGSTPFERIDSYGVYITSPVMAASTIDCFMRRSPLPVIGTIQSNEYILDLRTIDETDFGYIAGAFGEMLE